MKDLDFIYVVQNRIRDLINISPSDKAYLIKVIEADVNMLES